MRALKAQSKDTILVSALRARTHFGKLLRRVELDGRSLIIEKRGTPRAILLSIRDYVRLAAPEPEVLTLIGQESKRKGTADLSERQINQIVHATRATRARNSKRRKSV
jgi:prevent-host-death family protein